MRVLLACLAILVATGGCSGGKSKRYEIVGTSQKGPFISGSAVSAQGLNGNLEPTGQVFLGQISDEFGNFALPATLSSPYAEVVATGYFFDEVMDGISASTLTLRALANVSANEQVNLNVLTTLEKKRLKYLLAQGQSFLAAKEQAQRDVLVAFHIDSTGLGAAESLDITASGDGPAALLAVSTILLVGANAEAGPAGSPAAELTSLLSRFENDLESDGTIGDPGLLAILNRAGRYAKLASIRSTLEAHYASLGLTVTAPAFEGFMDSDGDGILNRDDSSVGAFTISSLPGGRYQTAAALLQDGSILITGGIDAADAATLTAMTFEPVTGVATLTSSMSTFRVSHAATTLQDGRVLVTGGNSLLGEVYEPGARRFAPAGSLIELRADHTATTLLDGRVLIAGGVNVTTEEVFDPAIPGFSAIGPMHSMRRLHTATLLQDGRVLLAGGLGPSSVTATAEIYDPVDDSFTLVGSMFSPRERHTATLLPDGRVLMLGGMAGLPVASAEIFYPSTGQFAPVTESMFLSRFVHGAALVSPTQVLAIGGRLDNAYETESSELLDLTTGLFSLGPSMSIARVGSTYLALPGGRALAIGANGAGTDTVEMLQP